MCGIAGALSRNGKRLDETSIARATRSLSHRGPDSQSWWTAANGLVALGHARLAIIDPLGGRQPLRDERDQIHAVVAGEFYDFERIRAELSERGHRFRSRSDSEILVHLYQEKGVACLADLRGEFSFLLWDGERRTLFAARDRFGIKPLFYHTDGETLWLASEAKALFAVGIETRWDYGGFLRQLFAFLPPDRTLFAGVRQIPPGHLLEATADSISVRSYWDLCYPRENELDSVNGSLAEWSERLREELETAVWQRLRADVPVGCFLSGGIDSSAVFGLAARHPAGAPTAFTIVFPDTPYDEGAVASETALQMGAAYVPIVADYDQIADRFEDAVWHAEILGVNSHGVARFLNSLGVKEAGYRVVLSGEGSDELLAGYGHIRQDSHRGKGAAPATLEALASVEARLGFVPSWISSLAVQRSFYHLLLSREATRQLGGRDLYGEFLEDFDLEGQVDGRADVHKSSYLWARSVLPNYILFAERLEMAHGIEVRLPFLDHHLFALIRRMPISVLAGPGREKRVLRDAVRGCVSETVYRRAKQPFTAPPATLEPGNRLFEKLESWLRSEALESLPFFDPVEVRKMLDKIPTLDRRTRIALDPILLSIGSACVLQSRYAVQG